MIQIAGGTTTNAPITAAPTTAAPNGNKAEINNIQGKMVALYH